MLLLSLQSLRDEADFALMLNSHDLSLVRHLCDRVLVMCKGEIVEQGRWTKCSAVLNMAIPANS